MFACPLSGSVVRSPKWGGRTGGAKAGHLVQVSLAANSAPQGPARLPHKWRGCETHKARDAAATRRRFAPSLRPQDQHEQPGVSARNVESRGLEAALTRGAERTASRRPGARRSAAPAWRRTAPARPVDRVPAQDSGPRRPPVPGAPRRVGTRHATGADRGLQGRKFLSPFRHRQRRRVRSTRLDGARVRRPVVRDGGCT